MYLINIFADSYQQLYGRLLGLYLIMCVCAVCSLAQSCLTLCGPMGCSPPGFTLHEIFQARILEYSSFPTPGDLLDPGIKPMSPAQAGGFFITSATCEVETGKFYFLGLQNHCRQ